MDPSAIIASAIPFVQQIVSGGPGAVAIILLLDMIAIGFISHYIIRLVLRAAKEQIDSRERLLVEKEALLKERTTRLEDLIEKYHQTQSQISNTMSRTENVLNEIRLRMMMITDHRSNRPQANEQ